VMDHVRLIDGLRAALGVEQWVVLGHSYGGMLACRYAHRYPARTLGVLYECPTWNVRRSSTTTAAAVLLFFEQQGNRDAAAICREMLDEGSADAAVMGALMRLAPMLQGDEISRYIHALTAAEYYRHLPDIDQHSDGCQDLNRHLHELEARGELTDEDMQVNHYIQQKAQTHTTQLIEQGDLFDDCLPLLSQITTPSRLLVGEYDLTCGQDQRDCFQAVYGQDQIEVFRDCCHLLRLAAPKQYTNAVIHFMEAVSK